MKAWCLDNKLYQLSLGKYDKQNNNASSLHILAREFLIETFPACKILEEVYIQSEKLYLDFFIPSLMIVIECQGDHHSEYVPFFHGINKMKFYTAVARDNKKKEWCRINNIRLIYFYPNEMAKDWEEKLSGTR